MKSILILAGVVVSTVGAPVSAATWVEYDVAGSGTATYVDQTEDPTFYASSLIKFSASFFVEVDPSDSTDGLGWGWSDGYSFGEMGAVSGAGYSSSGNASDGNLGLAYQTMADSFNIGDNVVVNLNYNYGSGTFATGLPISLPKRILGGSFSFDSLGHYTEFFGSGIITSATATVVDGDGMDSFDAQAVPEPASWALIVGGFALVGTAVRYRAVRLPLSKRRP